jgi:serine/threonine-protein kinase
VGTRKIADYTITRELGRGGMGTVYQALSPEGATVAIKTVLWPENVDPRARWEAIERFQREARAASSLSHPNICQVLDFGADEDSLYIVMEFLEGNTVRQLLGDAGVIRMDRAVEIISSVGEALAHAHDQGIIHRDIKPENIMVLRGGQAKLTDFGLAAVASERTLTMPGTTMGTMFYMSPEQVRGERLDARSDIFSLGATFYEMLTGVRAFQAEEPAAVMNQILTHDPPLIPGLAADLCEVLQRCLRKAPRDRFQSTREVITSLSAMVPDMGTGPTAVLSEERPGTAGEARVVAPAEALATRKPPPPLDTPEAEEADVRHRANFHYPEDFEGGLEWFVVGRSDWGVTTVEDDALVLTGAPPPWAGYPHYSAFHGAAMTSEFVMEARVTKLEGPDDWPFGFGHSAMPVDFYAFGLQGNGTVGILKCNRGQVSDLARVERCPQVNRGNAENVLKVVRRHGRLHIFVNQQHVLAAEDFDLGGMTPGLLIRSGVRVAFSEIRVEGISMRKVLYDIDTHMARLETREAREKLNYARLYHPMFVAPGIERALRSPDRSATVLVTLPSGARLTRGGDAPAKRLVDTINAKGADRPFHWATDVTETEVESDEAYLECPLIAIGHPDWSAMTRRLRDELPRDREVSTGNILIYHDIERGERRVALWGHDTRTDMDAVELFISSGLLDRFLAMVWEEG